MAELLPQLLDAALRRGLADFDADAAVTGPALIDPGMSRRESLTELAELLSGSSNKGSRAYKSARRQVERMAPRRGAPRQPTPAMVERLRRARRSQDQTIRRYRANGAATRLLIRFYVSRRPEWIPPHHWLHVPAADMRHVIAEWSRGDIDGAAGVFLAAVLRRYDVPNPDDWYENVEVVGLEIRPE